MSEYKSNTSIGMPRGSLLRIDDGAGVLVYVWEGELWLTQDDSPKDHMLLAGQSFYVERGGAALVHAFRRSTVSLSSPWPDLPARKVTLTRTGASAPVVLHQRRRMQPLAEMFRFLGTTLRTAA